MLGQQIAGQGRTVAAGPLHPGPSNRPKRADPLKQLAIASRSGREGFGADDGPQRGEHGGDMSIPVGVHAEDDLTHQGRQLARMWGTERSETLTAAPAEAGAREQAAIDRLRPLHVADQTSHRSPHTTSDPPDWKLGKGDGCLAGRRDPNEVGRYREKTAHRVRPRTQEPPPASWRGLLTSHAVSLVSPTALTLLDQKALTCAYAPDLDHPDRTRRYRLPVPGGSTADGHVMQRHLLAAMRVAQLAWHASWLATGAGAEPGVDRDRPVDAVTSHFGFESPRGEPSQAPCVRHASLCRSSCRGDRYREGSGTDVVDSTEGLHAAHPQRRSLPTGTLPAAVTARPSFRRLRPRSGPCADPRAPDGGRSRHYSRSTPL
ncbi:hypothetical protein T261_8335 [Streptomyces lydicus]|nr:hypothetical protein T261_8335 [Streptomyces lydicus]